jgi:Mrp family chromosome partitioning ATPase
VSDSVALAGAVDGVILVAQAGRVTTGEVAEALERLERVSAPVIGLALDQAASGERDTYAYGGYAPAAGTWPAPQRIDDGTQADEIVFSDA